MSQVFGVPTAWPWPIFLLLAQGVVTFADLSVFGDPRLRGVGVPTAATIPSTATPLLPLPGRSSLTSLLLDSKVLVVARLIIRPSC